jgi:predicted enzyme related to lactoylglutathione lyase
MRKILLALSAAVLLVGAPTLAEDKSALPEDVGSGRVAWFDLTTTDIAKSKAFYGPLFGWKFTAVAGTDLAAEIVSDTTAIGTLRVAEGAITPFNGVVYIQVADIQGSCKAAKELGGTIPPGFPFDLPGGIGAIALVVDPAGHPVGMYARTPMAKSVAPTVK